MKEEKKQIMLEGKLNHKVIVLDIVLGKLNKNSLIRLCGLLLYLKRIIWICLAIDIIL